jgi:hypothetical protein
MCRHAEKFFKAKPSAKSEAKYAQACEALSIEVSGSDKYNVKMGVN